MPLAKGPPDAFLRPLAPFQSSRPLRRGWKPLMVPNRQRMASSRQRVPSAGPCYRAKSAPLPSKSPKRGMRSIGGAAKSKPIKVTGSQPNLRMSALGQDRKGRAASKDVRLTPVNGPMSVRNDRSGKRQKRTCPHRVSIIVQSIIGDGTDGVMAARLASEAAMRSIVQPDSPSQGASR